MSTVEQVTEQPEQPAGQIVDENFEVKFTIGEINQLLAALGEIPAKHSIQIIAFIKGKAEQQVQAGAEPV
jgi:hypothetical protein